MYLFAEYESMSTAHTQQSSRGSTTSLQPPSYTPSPPQSQRSSISGSLHSTNHKPMLNPEKNAAKPERNSVTAKNEINLQLRVPQVTENLQVNVGKPEEDEIEYDWQYQLPSPPTAFRDSSPSNLTGSSNLDETDAAHFKPDSVVTSPELFDKLDHVKNETISESNSSVSDDDKMCNTLTLEHLEKRKSLVYNRELSTSLKMPDDSQQSISAKRSSVLSELEDVIQNNYITKPTILSRHNSHAKDIQQHSSELPNFVITTYDNPKKKFNIFEDDSVHSNVKNPKAESHGEDELTNLRRDSLGRSMENMSYRKHSLGNQSDDGIFKKPQDVTKRRTLMPNYFSKAHNDNPNFVARSGSFSTDYSVNNWKPTNPVKRSKSQLTLAKNERNRAEEEDDEGGMSKSNSLFDVSGLQSLGVSLGLFSFTLIS